MKAATVNFDRFILDFEQHYPQYLGCIYSVFDTDNRGVIKDNGVYLDSLVSSEYGFKPKDVWQGFTSVLSGHLGFTPDRIWMVSPSEMYVEEAA